MKLQRARTLAAPPAVVWALVRDPRALPRWWPRVERVEGVSGDGWTTVLRSPRGRIVRADWRLDGQDKERRRAWSQRVEGTPFAKVLHARCVEVRMEPEGEGTRVTVELEARPRRLAGRMLLRGPLRRELGEALAGLAQEVEP